MRIYICIVFEDACRGNDNGNGDGNDDNIFNVLKSLRTELGIVEQEVTDEKKTAPTNCYRENTTHFIVCTLYSLEV